MGFARCRIIPPQLHLALVETRDQSGPREGNWYQQMLASATTWIIYVRSPSHPAVLLEPWLAI